MKNRMKKSLTLLLAVVMMLCAVPFTEARLTANAESQKSGYLTYDTFYGDVRITGCDPEAKGKLTIPSKIKGYSVCGIDDYAFEKCRELTSIVIPNGVKYIGKYAFENCTGLTEITLPDTVTTIGTSAFYHCESLTSIKIPKNVSEIDISVFCGCLNLKTVTVDSRNTVFHSNGNCIIKTAEKSLIAGCTGSVIPSDGSVTSIAPRAFEVCKGLKSITIPGAVKEIGWAAFYNCTDLKSVVLKNGVETIDYIAFQKCEELEELTIPNSVKTIGLESFRECGKLKKVVIPGSVNTIRD